MPKVCMIIYSRPTAVPSHHVGLSQDKGLFASAQVVIDLDPGVLAGGLDPLRPDLRGTPSAPSPAGFFTQRLTLPWGGRRSPDGYRSQPPTPVQPLQRRSGGAQAAPARPG
uniref:Uncharacterized protein n=1 Tax=Micrurus corallinus TaxID=54390 RepID=A0A2D4GVJ6_MICCO